MSHEVGRDEEMTAKDCRIAIQFNYIRVLYLVDLCLSCCPFCSIYVMLMI